MNTKDALDYFDAIDKTTLGNRPGPAIGAVRKTALALNCSVQAIYKWGDKVPENIAYKIHYMSKGKVSL